MRPSLSHTLLVTWWHSSSFIIETALFRHFIPSPIFSLFLPFSPSISLFLSLSFADYSWYFSLHQVSKYPLLQLSFSVPSLPQPYLSCFYPSPAHSPPMKSFLFMEPLWVCELYHGKSLLYRIYPFIVKYKPCLSFWVCALSLRVIFLVSFIFLWIS